MRLFRLGKYYVAAKDEVEAVTKCQEENNVQYLALRVDEEIKEVSGLKVVLVEEKKVKEPKKVEVKKEEVKEESFGQKMARIKKEKSKANKK